MRLRLIVRTTDLGPAMAGVCDAIVEHVTYDVACPEDLARRWAEEHKETQVVGAELVEDPH